jgi:hypothetical protein
MTKTTTYALTLVLFSTLASAGCGSDPYSGDSTPPGTGGVTPGTGGAGTGGAMPGTGGAVTGTGGVMPGNGGAVTGTGGAVTGTGGAGIGTAVGQPDAGAPDAPIGDPTINYNIAVSTQRLLDLVFMIDNSPSMAPKVVKLQAQFPKLIAALKDPTDGTLPDLRVAIIDSDLGTGGAYTSGSCGPKALPDGSQSPYGDLGRFQMIHATNCGVTSANATYLEYSKGAPVNFTGDINTVFACLAGNLGTLGCGEEHSLQAFEFALIADGLGDINNAQRLMLRPNAYLGLVFLTDEDDCSAAPNDGMFGEKSELRDESASLRCYTRSHECNNNNLTSDSGPGYPTSKAFTALFKDCAARTDSCTSLNPLPDNSQPTPQCSPLKDIKTLANEIKGLKSDPANQVLVAGIFGYPLSDADMAMATYKIDKIPNPNTADTAHPMVYDSWPVCYDPQHKPADPNTFDANAAGWGATAGLREAAFIDEFGPNGLKFSICQTDFSASMKLIGDSIAKKLQNLCINDKLRHDSNGVPDCSVVYRTPIVDPATNLLTYQESPNALPVCPAGATSGNVVTDCWQLSSDKTKCPDAFNGQLVNVLRTADEIKSGPLTAGTLLGMQCKICSTSPSADPVAGCTY